MSNLASHLAVVAPDTICQRCGEPATIHSFDRHNGHSDWEHLCLACAARRAGVDPPRPDPFDERAMLRGEGFAQRR